MLLLLFGRGELKKTNFFVVFLLLLFSVVEPIVVLYVLIQRQGEVDFRVLDLSAPFLLGHIVLFLVGKLKGDEDVGT